MPAKTVRFRDWLDKQMKDPEFREAYEELDPAYQIARLRILRGLTQREFAERMGTTQSSVARLESGSRDISMPTLRKAAAALGADLSICLVPQGKVHGQG